MAAKILVIDDEKETVELIAMLLTRRGFDVCQAYCAQEGLRMAYQYQPRSGISRRAHGVHRRVGCLPASARNV